MFFCYHVKQEMNDSRRAVGKQNNWDFPTELCYHPSLFCLKFTIVILSFVLLRGSLINLILGRFVQVPNKVADPVVTIDKGITITCLLIIMPPHMKYLKDYKISFTEIVLCLTILQLSF